MEKGEMLYEQYLAGNDDAFVEIIKEYQSGLTLFLYRMTQDYHAAEDLVEDTFVKIATRRPRYSGKAAFKTWLYTIGSNLAKDYLRRLAIRRVISLDDLSVEPICDEDLEKNLVRCERDRAVKKAMSRLALSYRQVLYLVYYERFSNSQAAQIMRKTNRQVENLIYRAKRLMKMELEKEGIFYEEL